MQILTHLLFTFSLFVVGESQEIPHVLDNIKKALQSEKEGNEKSSHAHTFLVGCSITDHDLLSLKQESARGKLSVHTTEGRRFSDINYQTKQCFYFCQLNNDAIKILKYLQNKDVIVVMHMAEDAFHKWKYRELGIDKDS